MTDPLLKRLHELGLAGYRIKVELETDYFNPNRDAPRVWVCTISSPRTSPRTSVVADNVSLTAAIEEALAALTGPH